jgi:hypothetical protein
MIYGVLGPKTFDGQDYTNYEHVKTLLSSFQDATKLISGGSKGVERLVEDYAKEANIELAIIPPDMTKHRQNLAAFTMRNIAIMQASDVLIIFWDGRNNPALLEAMSSSMQSQREVYLIPMK